MAVRTAGTWAIVLAAGDSTRMGSQKLLLPFGGKTVVEHIVDTLLETRIVSVAVVTGRDDSRVREVLGHRELVVVTNPEPERGMLSSIRIGVECAGAEASSFMVVLGDQPAIQIGVVNALVDDMESAGGGISVPKHGDRRGYPIIISGVYRDAVLHRYDDIGLRGLMREYADQVREVPVSEEWILDDMDYPEDYERELRRLDSEQKK